jgi:hypothetical protein
VVGSAEGSPGAGRAVALAAPPAGSGEEEVGVPERAAAGETEPDRIEATEAGLDTGEDGAVGRDGDNGSSGDADDPAREPEAPASSEEPENHGAPDPTPPAEAEVSTAPEPAPAEAAPRPDPGPASPPVLTGGPVAIRDDALLPRQRIVAFYGNPASTRMGILGELPPDQMLERLDREVEAWRRADPSLPVKPALHLITTMAAGDPGRDGLYRVRLPDRRIAEVKEWAGRRDALLFLDIQPGRSTVERELPRLREWLADPDVHLALDPEWNMGPQGFPGRVIGSMSAEEINHAIRFLAEIVEEHDLPPKVLVVHRFTQRMVRGATEIVEDPRVQVVLHMDGWGPPAQKLHTYRTIVAPEAEQFLGFKLFYKNDRKGGSRMLTPGEILALRPVPLYIQYQ